MERVHLKFEGDLKRFDRMSVGCKDKEKSSIVSRFWLMTE